jgi:hypothetical protein
MVERVNRTLADIIASYVSKEPTTWSDFLPSATFAYNTAVHASTGYSPFYLMYGREATEPQDRMKPVRNRNMTDPISQMWYDALEIAREKLIEAKEKQKIYYDRNAKRVEFKIGDKILLKAMANTSGKFNMRWDGPYAISEKKGNVNYKIYADNGKKMMIVHADRMKIFYEKSPSDSSQQIIEPQSESEPKTKLPHSIITDPRPIQQSKYNLRKTIRMPDRYRAN